MGLFNAMIPEDIFLEQREAVLAQWPTGSQVCLQEGINYQGNLVKDKVFVHMLDKLTKIGQVATQPRCGVPQLEDHIALLTYLEDVGEADFLSTTIDSYTRQNQYQQAQEGLEESQKENRAMLNGFPAVNHGIDGCRQIVEMIKAPVQIRHGTADARLLAEITLAAGFSAFEGGGISYNIPYTKDVALELSIKNWQYVDRLVGYYQQAGVPILREPFGPLTGTMIPPCISISVGIIEALLAAQQGVKHISLGYGQGGNLIQDVAALRCLNKLSRDYLDQAGYEDVQVSTVFHQWMGGFPQDEARAGGVISLGAVAAALAGAHRVIVKSNHEALGIPTKEANAYGLRMTKQVLDMLRHQQLSQSPELDCEFEMISLETLSILERTFMLGEQQWAQGVIQAFASGVLDVPFAPSRRAVGRILPVRDDQGAIRLLDFGNLPWSDDIKKFHNEKIAQRGQREGRTPNFQMVIDDIYAIGKGMLIGRPRG